MFAFLSVIEEAVLRVINVVSHMKQVAAVEDVVVEVAMAAVEVEEDTEVAEEVVEEVTLECN